MTTSEELTRRKMSKVIANSEISSSSDYTFFSYEVEGNNIKYEDGCCVDFTVPKNPYKIALVRNVNQAPPSFTPILICTLLEYSSSIPSNQPLTIRNLTNETVVYFLGNSPGIPIIQLALSDSIGIGETKIIPANISQGQTAFYYSNLTNPPPCPYS